MWTNAVAAAVRKVASKPGPGRPVVVLERLAACTRRQAHAQLCRRLWDSDHAALEGPVVLLVPGMLIEARVYRFVGQAEEFMYRGDIL